LLVAENAASPLPLVVSSKKTDARLNGCAKQMNAAEDAASGLKFDRETCAPAFAHAIQGGKYEV
jgi:hypothetical protein